MFYSGINLHKDNIVVATLDESGVLLAEVTLPTDVCRIQAHFRQFSLPHQAVIESTSNWYWLSDMLSEAGIGVHLAHAKYLKAISYAKVKTDPIDALTLAQLLRMNLIPEAHRISPTLRGMRDLMRARLRLTQKNNSNVNSIQRLLEKFNLKHVPDAEFWTQPSPHLPAEYQRAQKYYQHQYDLISRQILDLEKSLHPVLVPNADIQLLLSIPGIGKILAFTLYLEIDGIGRFPGVRNFYSYARLVPGADNSNRKQRHKSGSKDGNKYLKIGFNEAAGAAIRHYAPIRAHYQRLLRNKPKTQARNLIAKELAKIVYYVLTTRTMFRTYKGIAIEKSHEWPRLTSPVA